MAEGDADEVENPRDLLQRGPMPGGKDCLGGKRAAVLDGEAVAGRTRDW